MFEHLPSLLSFWIKFSLKNSLYITIFILIEFWTIWIEFLNSLSRLTQTYKLKNFVGFDYMILSKLNTVNPLYFLEKYIQSEKFIISQCSETNCNLNNFTILIVALGVTTLMIIHHLWGYLKLNSEVEKAAKLDYSQTNETSNSKFMDLLNFLLINLLDVIFKIFSIFIFYIFLNKSFVSLYFNLDLVYTIISIVFLIIFTFFSYFQLNFIFLFMRLDSQDSLHYDMFSKSYDSLLFIIKIIIALNKNLIFVINEESSNARLIIALDYMLIFLLFNYTSKMLLNITYDKNLNFVTNFNFNLLRIFNTVFICVNILMNVFFETSSNYQLILILICTLILSTSILIYINNYVNVLIFKDEKMIYQATYLLDLFLQGDSMNNKFQMISIKVRSFHNINCNNVMECQICNQSDITITQEINNPNKLNLISALFKLIEKTTIGKMSSEEIDYFKLINLIFDYHLTLIDTSIPRFNIIYKTKDLLDKNKEKQNNFYHNLVLFYKKINYQEDVDLTKFSVIKNYDSSLFSLRKSIEIIIDILFTVDSRVKKDLYPQTNQLNNFKIEIMTKLEEIHLDKNTFNDNFSFLMTKFIFEKTFNIEVNSDSKILNGSDQFEYRNDYIIDHYLKDRILIIKHDHFTGSLIVTRATKELLSFQGKPLEMIFAKNYRDSGKRKFINEILNNKDKFEFDFIIELSDLNPMRFVKNVKLDCKIYRSPDLQEIFIISNYEISEEEILVFESQMVSDLKNNISNHDINHSKLITFSWQLNKTLLIDPNCIENLLISKLPKNSLIFNDIFRKINLPSSINKNNKIQDSSNINMNNSSLNDSESSNIDFVINYKSYYLNFFSNIEQNLHSIENEHIHKYLSEVKVLSDANISLKCQLKLKYILAKSENTNICIFSFKNISSKISSNLFRGFREEKISDENKENKNFNADDSSDNLLNNDHFNKNQSSSASVSISVNSAKSSGGLRDGILSSISINGKKPTLNESDRKMTNFNIATLFINFCLGLYCVFFLVIGFSSNNKMKQLNVLNTYFNTFERMFYQTALSQFYNVGVYKEGTTYMDDYLFGGYWDQFLGTGLTISMGDYANSELFVKADFLKQNLIDLQNFIYDSIYKDDLDNIFYFNTDYKVLFSGEDNELKLQTRNPNFFETILMFMNNAKASVFYTTNTMIYIHNYDLHTGKYDFSSFFDKNVTNVQKAVYEAIFNFPVYLNNFNKITLQVQQLFYSQVDNIFNLNLYLSLILIGLHMFLLIVSISIISFLKKTIFESNYIYAKIVTGDWTRYLTSKLFVLKELIDFYKIDPIKSSSKLKKDLGASSKLIKENQENEKNQNIHVQEKNSDYSEEAQISIKNLISPLIKVLIYLFTFYLIYAFSFILIFDSSKKDIILTSNFATEYYKVEKGIMNSILLLQCILFSNQTDYSLNQYMKNYKNFTSDPEYKNGYIWNIIEEAKISRNYISYLEKNYQKIALVEKRANEIAWCDYLYKDINDDIFSVTKKAFPGDSLIENLAILCKHYPVMDLSYYKNLITEINYIAAKMVRSYLHSYPDYKLMKKTNDETEFFDEFTIAVMIIRPIQTYLINNNIAELTKSTEDNFVIIVIVFMIGNILVECLIFFVINKKLIGRVLVINDEIRCLTLCLTA